MSEDVAGLVERLRWIIDPSASAHDRFARRAHLTSHDLRQCIDALTRLSGEGWQDIATAPRDGTEFLSAGGTQGRAGSVYPTRWLSPGPYTTENGKNAAGERRHQYPEGFYWAGYDGFVGPADPTVWRPFPTAPGQAR